MPIPCAGFTFTWGGSSLSEVQSIESDVYGGNLPAARTSTWTPNLGRVLLTGFSLVNLPTSDYGTRKRLTIQSPAGTLFDADCIYSGYAFESRANDAVRFVITFTIQDTLGAPSSP